MKGAPFLLALCVAACAAGQGAPISYGGGAQPPASRAAERAEPAAPARTPAAQAEPDWADGQGTPLSAYALRPEDVQPFDPARLPRTHRVGVSESLFDIATTYQLPLRALIDQNNLEPPYALAPGRELQLPPPRFHAVTQSESFEDIARRYNVDLRSLALLNRMQPPYRVRQGDRVVLPAMARAMQAATPPATQTPPRSQTPPVLGGRFTMPMRGNVVARFGAQPGGGTLDGIEIAGREGAQIVAAADGDVFYAGSDLPAYGVLVLIRHADNYVSAYAYTRRALVREGQHVRAGEAIAELGERSEGQPRLLFQVRQGSAAVDPGPMLGAALN